MPESTDLRTIEDLGKVTCPITDKQLQTMSLEELEKVLGYRYLPSDFRSQLEAYIRGLSYDIPN